LESSHPSGVMPDRDMGSVLDKDDLGLWLLVQSVGHLTFMSPLLTRGNGILQSRAILVPVYVDAYVSNSNAYSVKRAQEEIG
jgi:hypothetical protein